MKKRGILRWLSSELSSNSLVSHQKFVRSIGAPYHVTQHSYYVIRLGEDVSPCLKLQIITGDGDVSALKINMEAQRMVESINSLESMWAFIRKYDLLGKYADENRFVGIRDFHDCMQRFGEVGFVYNDVAYSITHPLRPLISFGEAYNEDSFMEFDTIDQLLNAVIQGERLREIITKVRVFERTV